MARKSLDFDPKYKEMILSGRKMMTIRRGTKNYSEGEIITVTFGGKKCCKARILSVRYIRYCDLTEGDAIADGFRNLEELKKELRKFYGDIPDEEIMTLISFEIMR